MKTIINTLDKTKVELIAILNILFISYEFLSNLPLLGVLHMSAVIYLFHKFVK